MRTTYDSILNRTNVRNITILSRQREFLRKSSRKNRNYKQLPYRNLTGEIRKKKKFVRRLRRDFRTLFSSELRLDNVSQRDTGHCAVSRKSNYNFSTDKWSQSVHWKRPMRITAINYALGNQHYTNFYLYQTDGATWSFGIFIINIKFYRSKEKL